MQATEPIFKAWAPHWLIQLVLCLALFPSSILLGLYGSHTADTAGYYGFEPTDVQFSLLVFYAGLVAFFPLDPRFSSYLLSRQYFIGSAVLMVGSAWLSTQVQSLPAFLGLRFVQGVGCAAIGSPCLTLIFSQLASERARALGYTLFYGGLLASAPLGTALSALVLDRFSFPLLFECYILVQLPGAVLLVLLLHNVRLKRRLPLSQLDWPSFVLLSAPLLALAYLVSYGQQLYWLADARIGVAVLVLLGGAALFGLRQGHLKRPYLNLQILRYRRFRLGLLLFVPYYLCRGTVGIATSYFLTVLHFDADSLAALQLATLAGLALSMGVVVRFVLAGYAMRGIWLTGFGLLLAYHGWMYYLFGPARGPEDFVLPMLLQGLGTGTLMVPLVVFTLSDLPAHLSGSGSYAAVATRFTSFSLSMALVTYCQLLWRTDTQLHLAQYTTTTNPLLISRLQGYQHTLQSKDLAAETAQRGALRLLAAAVDAQSQLRFAMSYYGMVCVGIGGVLLALLVVPHLRQRLLRFRQRPL